jgi:hypothetical protein
MMNLPNSSSNSIHDVRILAYAELERRKRAKASRLEFRGAALSAQSISASEWIISGPAETGKTFASMYRLHKLLSTYPNARATILRKVRSSIPGTALETWKRVVQFGSLQPKPYGGVNPYLYVYPNGSIAWIGGMDNADKILSAERDYIYVNQAEELTADDWEKLTTRTTGRGSVVPNPMLFGDCNPGDPDHWILHRARSNALELLRSTHRDNPTLHDGTDWTEQGRKTIDKLQSLTGPRYARLYLGDWVRDDGPESFLPAMALWDQCTADVAQLDQHQPVVIALDAAISGDTFALVAVSRDVTNPERVVIRDCRIWVPGGTALDYTQIETEIRDMIERYNVVQVAYDPYQLHYFAQRLADVVWAEPFNQNADRLESDVTLRTMIVQRKIMHDGSHAQLREHLANADAKIDESGHKLRIVKRASHLKIDAAVALSMATYRAVELNLW